MRICSATAPVARAFALSLFAVAAAAASGEDCNENNIPDSDDIEIGTSTDCNANGVPDECDIADGTSNDCNEDGLPDECAFCPPVDIVFVMDTSHSMNDEGDALCSNIPQIQADLLTMGITTHLTILGITEDVDPNFPCLQDSVAELLGTSVPGSPGETLNHPEDWGPATAIVSQEFGWLPGAVRVIIPMSDEGAQNGNACYPDGSDGMAVDNAIAIANANNVVVSPIAGTGSIDCVIDLMAELAMGTGGTSFVSTDPASDLANAIIAMVLELCDPVTDCNSNGIPDECEPDCNENGIPDDCDGGCPPVEIDCAEFDRFDDLTPQDTLTLLTNFHNPEIEQGYVYAYATDAGGNPIGHDYLIGQMLVVNGLDTFEYSMNAFDFAAGVGQGNPTDLDMDGVRDLDGAEYQKTAGEILVPRFLGQQELVAEGALFLIALSGGTEFDTTVDFLIYNDNEVPFSGEFTFNCYAKVRLLEISGAFGNDFLINASNHDQGESVGTRESGWFRMDGGVASSSVLTIQDPAFLAAYVERIGAFAAGDLPFERCLQDGHLLPDELTGDNSEFSSGGAPTQSCDADLGRRDLASLLIYPEFNNRLGNVSVLTVTNTSQSEETRVHFHYIGRYANP